MGERVNGLGRQPASHRWSRENEYSASTPSQSSVSTALGSSEERKQVRSPDVAESVDVEGKTQARLSNATVRADGDGINTEVKQLREQLEELRKSNKRVRERAAARISKDALASAKAIGELEAELARVNEALNYAHQELADLKNGQLASAPLQQELDQVRAQLTHALGEIEALRSTRDGAVGEPQALPPGAHPDQNTPANQAVDATMENQLRQMQLRADLDAAMLRKERERLAEVERELRAAQDVIASKDAKIALLSDVMSHQRENGGAPGGKTSEPQPKSRRLKSMFRSG